jgi:hypothetical protein
MPIAKAAVLEALDKMFQEHAEDRRINDGPRHGILPCNIEGRNKQFLKLVWF